MQHGWRRGLATEFGLTVSQGIGKLEELMALVEADEAFPKPARQAIRGLLDHRDALAESIETFEAEIVRSRLFIRSTATAMAALHSEKNVRLRNRPRM